MARGELRRGGQREELVGDAAQIVHDALGHAVAVDREEADVAARGVDGGGGAPAVGGAAGARG